MDVSQKVIVRRPGQVEYLPTWRAMQAFTQARDENTPDEIWMLEHPPVFTQGRAGKAEHVLAPGDIPVVQVDRGGQVTYHGPGQLVGYLLIDLRRKKITIRGLVDAIEQSIIAVLGHYGIEATHRCDAPGVYVGAAKIASLGMRVQRGCSYHGLALNLDCDLGPFSRINPCGYQGLEMTRLCDLLPEEARPSLVQATDELLRELCIRLQYSNRSAVHGIDGVAA